MTKQQAEDWKTQWEARRKFFNEREDDTEDYYKSIVAPFLPFLRQAGVVLADCSFYGSGDSGDLTGFNLFNDRSVGNCWNQDRSIECLVPGTLTITSRSVVFNKETQKCEYQYTDTGLHRNYFGSKLEDPKTPVDVRRALEIALHHILDDANIDWYNNDGGGGRFQLEVTDTGCEIYLYIYNNVVTQETCIDIGEYKSRGGK